MRYEICAVFITSVIVFQLTSGAIPSACQNCMKSSSCLPPDCFCCRDDLNLPNITLSQIPQMVFFTFDDAVTGQAAGFYKQLFAPSRKNPNGCPITMTLFISHDNTEYRLVSEFHNLGMEIASHSVTHSTMNGTNFFEEAKAQKENLAKLAGIPIGEISGWRSPFLKPTGDLQPDALKKLGYTYDATLTFSKRSFREKPPGPFTLDFGYPYECQVKPCPKSRHPGFWEIPVVSLMDYKQAYDCVYVDGCMNAPPDEETAYKFLWDNFHNYYTTTKMPFGINMHPSWFYYPDRLKAMDRFIQKLVSLNDVYIVSANKVLEWLKRPTPLQDLHSFAPWACDGSEKTFKSGPRLVKTNLPPPPAPRSFIQWSNSPRVVYTPAPPNNKRVFTQTRLFTPQKSQTNTLQVLPSPIRTNLFSVDRQNDNTNGRRQSVLRHHNTRWRSPQSVSASRTLRDPGSIRRVTRLRRPEVLPPPVLPSLTQRERLEQHEERMRQRRIFEEKQRQNELLQQRRQQQQQQQRQEELRQQELLNQQQQQQRHHELIQLQRQKEMAEQQQAAASSQMQGNVLRPQGDTPAKQRILWAPSVMSQEISSDIISKVDKHRNWTPVQQETVKVWPPTPTFRNRFSGRRQSSNPRTTILQTLPPGTSLATPAPISSHSRSNILFTDSPRHVWYSDMVSRFGPSVNAPRFGRGGSNRRLGFRDPTITIHTSDIQSQRPRRIQPQRLMIANNSSLSVRPRELSEPIRDRRLGQSRSTSVLSRSHNPAPSVEVRSSQGDSSFSRRNILHPTVAQQLAWNSFIRKMLGPH